MLYNIPSIAQMLRFVWFLDLMINIYEYQRIFVRAFAFALPIRRRAFTCNIPINVDCSTFAIIWLTLHHLEHQVCSIASRFKCFCVCKLYKLMYVYIYIYLYIQGPPKFVYTL